ncbi:hypothetical protein C5167_037926 [Papaver somniferum]|uniref:Uncharacterized protein n=1 Tax=Papaver somniferum TaxID=3469 RepID=A0A4Y7IC42_PAPSO|nr:uncharacterized protein LOC113291377 isoform X1 [Papaver somniferum]RZC44985.1 hypothetical protein C5167_037926 [Papaver somniferum]
MKVMAITLNSRLFPPNPCRSSYTTTGLLQRKTIGNQWWGVVHYSSTSCRHNLARNSNLVVLATGGSSSDDYLPFDMSVENALEILGVNKGSSFDDILNAKNSILASSQNDPEMVEQVEAAYDMLLMQSLMQRCAGKVVNNSIRYADVQTVNGPDMSSTPQSLQATLKRIPVSVEAPSANNLGIHAGVYGALMGLTYINGASVSSGEPYAGADIPGLILAAGFGASIYLLTKKNNSPRMSTVITIGGLVVGATMGSAVEDWLQVDIIPFLGIHSPAVVVSEFILFSQFLVSLYVK